jgi:hypothetical protein
MRQLLAIATRSFRFLKTGIEEARSASIVGTAREVAATYIGAANDSSYFYDVDPC